MGPVASASPGGLGVSSLPGKGWHSQSPQAPFLVLALGRVPGWSQARGQADSERRLPVPRDSLPLLLATALPPHFLSRPQGFPSASIPSDLWDMGLTQQQLALVNRGGAWLEQQDPGLG